MRERSVQAVKRSFYHVVVFDYPMSVNVAGTSYVVITSVSWIAPRAPFALAPTSGKCGVDEIIVAVALRRSSENLMVGKVWPGETRYGNKSALEQHRSRRSTAKLRSPRRDMWEKFLRFTWERRVLRANVKLYVRTYRVSYTNVNMFAGTYIIFTHARTYGTDGRRYIPASPTSQRLDN